MCFFSTRLMISESSRLLVPVSVSAAAFITRRHSATSRGTCSNSPSSSSASSILSLLSPVSAVCTQTSVFCAASGAGVHSS